MRTRKSAAPAVKVLSDLAKWELQQWEAEKAARYAHRPVGTVPHYVNLNSPWTR